MAKSGTLPSFCYNNTYSDAHVSLPQTMNEANREESMKEEVRNGNTRLEMKILPAKQFQDKISFQ